jgi:hypothetical protein
MHHYEALKIILKSPNNFSKEGEEQTRAKFLVVTCV